MRLEDNSDPVKKKTGGGSIELFGGYVAEDRERVEEEVGNVCRERMRLVKVAATGGGRGRGFELEEGSRSRLKWTTSFSSLVGSGRVGNWSGRRLFCVS